MTLLQRGKHTCHDHTFKSPVHSFVPSMFPPSILQLISAPYVPRVILCGKFIHMYLLFSRTTSHLTSSIFPRTTIQISQEQGEKQKLVIVCIAQSWNPPAVYVYKELEKLRKSTNLKILVVDADEDKSQARTWG